MYLTRENEVTIGRYAPGNVNSHMNPSCEQDLNPANRPQGFCVHSQGEFSGA